MRCWCIVLALLFFVPLTADHLLVSTLEQAQACYHQGEIAEDRQGAETSFNCALELYQSLAVGHTSAALHGSIANCYYQLGEYPWAILHYERALALHPRSETFKDSLQAALSRSGLGLASHKPSLLQLLTGARWISLAERIHLCGIFGLILAIIGSIALWSSARWLYRLSFTLGVITILLLGSVVALEWASSADGVLVRSTMVRCDAGNHYAPIQPQPLYGGSKIAINRVTKDGKWVKVTTRDGTKGYIPAESVRMV